jgi:hypothetical protein
MSLTPQPGSVLLDKGIIRRLYERRVRFALGEPPTFLQVEAANAYSRIGSLTERVYITEQTSNVLERRFQIFARDILAETECLRKGSYMRRWARRLREFSFSAEGAVILAYGSFGSDSYAATLGVDLILTTDNKLASHYHERYADIAGRFWDMIVNLSEPYSKAKLPEVITAADLLKLA